MDDNVRVVHVGGAVESFPETRISCLTCSRLKTCDQYVLSVFIPSCPFSSHTSLFRTSWSSSTLRATSRFPCWRTTSAKHAASRISSTNTSESSNSPMTTWREPKGLCELLMLTEIIQNFKKTHLEHDLVNLCIL